MPFLVQLPQAPAEASPALPIHFNVDAPALLSPLGRPNYDKDVLTPLRAAQAKEAADLAAAQAAQAAADALAAQQAAQVAQASYTAPAQSYSTSGGTLTGSIGYALSGGNCVLEVPPSIRPNGNPITWQVTTQTPYIGAVALFYFNHVAIVTGIWSNGDIEVRQQNWSGTPITRFPRSEFRGFR